MFKVILTIANVSVILEVYATLQNDSSLEIMSTRTVSLKVKQIYIYISVETQQSSYNILFINKLFHAFMQSSV